jgi:hypothetical protein
LEKKTHFVFVFTIFYCQVLENTGRAIKKEQSKETGNTWHRRQEKHNATCVGHHHTQTLIILQTTGGKDEPNTVFIRKQ